MGSDALKTPVAFFVFRRPDTTQQVFDRIAQARPRKLLLVADGPRQDRPGEADACRQVREIVARVDWPCEVSRNFSERNLGCGERMISGLNWVFSQVEEAIILEDDCLPDFSFFRFCEELLEKYRDDDRIAYISGDNLVGKAGGPADSFYFSRIGGIWGWATWRSEWQRYDRHLNDWPTIREQGLLKELFDEPEAIAFWNRIFDAMHDKTGPDTWDYQWLFTGLKNNSLTIVPSVNLITNIGFGANATHTIQADSPFRLPAATMKFPLNYPASFIPLRSLDRLRVRAMLPPALHRRIATAIAKVASRFR